ncbi:hypothetical protein GCM10023170_097160 [Phytohabitans houttuyneae]|uniref:NB-ARC domain-containing protein n=2 Tax=Phytohabitans houttuyneae TaxID=1076126 RepID=A0A6V8K5F2_9ACTN|nr:hypothetical protein Phou_015690 [Phytohabitans houttuyneae]
MAIWQQRLAEPPGLWVMARQEPAAPPAELPAVPASFAGRAEDVVAIDRLIQREHRVIAITGPPGVGKSSLAVWVAHAWAADYPDGQLFVPLGGASGEPARPGAVLARLLGALGAAGDERRGDVDELSARFRSVSARRRVLMVLDDARAADQVRPLLPGGASCLVLITSRWLLVELAPAVSHPISGLGDEECLALLANAAGADRIVADRAGATRLVRLCGGFPLAVGIAGARLRARPTWTPGQLAERLDDERGRLDELKQGDLAVRSAFEASYAELSELDRLVFRRVGAHPGRTFGLGAGAAMVGAGATAHRDVAGVLERLVDSHLIESLEPGRYRLHDLLRLFAAERLAAEEPPEERLAVLTRLLERLATEASAGAWLLRERETVVTAVHDGVAAGAHEAVWQLVSAVSPLLDGAGDHPDRLALWSDAATAAAALGEGGRRCQALCGVCHAYHEAGDVRRSLEPAAEAVAIATSLGDRRLRAEALYAYGETLAELSQFAAAEEPLLQSVALFAELSDRRAEIRSRVVLGELYNESRRPEHAVKVLERALALLTDLADERMRAAALRTLAAANRLIGRRAEALSAISEAMLVGRRLGDQRALGLALAERGQLALDDDRHDDAVGDFREMLEMFRNVRDGLGIGSAQELIGDALAAAGRPVEALSAYDASIAEFDRLHDHVRVGLALLRRAAAQRASDRPASGLADRARADELLGVLDLPVANLLRERLDDEPG